MVPIVPGLLLSNIKNTTVPTRVRKKLIESANLEVKLYVFLPVL